MTEKTEYVVEPEFNALAFAIALVAAPGVIAVLGCWFYFLPILALAMGFTPYLIFGGPALWLYLRFLPFIPLVPSTILFAVNYVLFSGDGSLAQSVFGYGPTGIELRLAYGSVFAPLWGIAFEAIYALTRNHV